MKPRLKKLFLDIKKDYRLIAPVKKNLGLFLSPVTDLNRIQFSPALTLNTFKDFLFPAKQQLFRFAGQKIVEEAAVDFPQLALFGISIMDLRAWHLYNQVFRHDPVYQQRKSRALILGYLKIASVDQPIGIFNERLEEDTLEHLEFDIFILESQTGMYFYAGSKLGQQRLSQAGVKDFENIEFVGPIKESGLDPQMLANYRSIKNSFERQRSVWEELGRRCLACGKCSLVCPTCFCFSTEYQFGQAKKTGERLRRWETCFYSDFSQVAGGHKFLETISRRIYFWYEHKFVRIPDEFSIPGCVGCGRCIKVCPVNIDLRTTLADLAPTRPKPPVSKKKTSRKK